MNKTEFRDGIRLFSNLNKQQSEEALEAMEKLITSALMAGVTIKLPGIGTLEAHKTPERIGRNPRTGAQITVPAKTRVALYASATLKKHLNP